MKLLSRKLWFPLSISGIVLSSLLVAGTSIANRYAPMVNDALNIETSKVVDTSTDSHQYYSSDYSNLEEMFQAKNNLLRQVGQEGTVLLKNDSLLPLSSGKKVALFNESAFRFDTGTGGGSMHADEVKNKKLTLSEALKKDGLSVVEEANVSSADVALVVIGRNGSEGNDLPKGSLALSSDEKASLDSAVQSGKPVILLTSGDEYPQIEDYASKNEVKAVLHFGNAGFRGAMGLADVLVGKVSPSGALTDTYSVRPESTPAYENWGDFEYTNKNKLMASQSNKYVIYQEGIYTDYFYYETRYEDSVLKQENASSAKGSLSSAWKYKEEVLYPFGYGLSYTTFEESFEGDPTIDKTNKTVSFSVRVKNTGSVKGKAIVEVYSQSPYTDYDKENLLEKPSVRLAAFAKSKELAPEEEETLSLSFSLRDLASYDRVKTKGYLYEKGTYYLALGSSSHDALNNILAKKGKSKSDGMDNSGDASLVYSFEEKEDDKDLFLTSAYTGNTITNHFDDVDINYFLPDNEKITYLSRSDWDKTYPSAQKITASESLLSRLNDTKKYASGTSTDSKKRAEEKDNGYVSSYLDYKSEDEVNAAVSRYEYKNVLSLKDKDFDDPEWQEILRNISLYELSRLIAEGRNAINAVPLVSLPEATGSDGPAGLTVNYRYKSIDKTTGKKVELTSSDTIEDNITRETLQANNLDGGVYSSEPVLASTFNKALAEEIGKMYAEDALYIGASFHWGLGANLHRTSYGGRSSEYYSSDPLLTGKIGASLTKAAKQKGLNVVAKHFVLNEQDQNRIGISTYTNEQVLREHYLESFEILNTEGDLAGIMTAYNRIGALSCTAEYDLLVTVLREEWNSKAYVISDLNSPTPGLYDGSNAIVSGLSTFLNNGTYNAASGSTTNTSLNVEALKNDTTLCNAAQRAAHYILFQFIHSNAINGFSSASHIVYITPWWKPTLVTLSVLFIVIASASAVLYVLSAVLRKE